MTDEKTCYNCGNKNCNVYYSMVKKDYKRHFETYEYKDFDCVNHNKWEELKMEEIHTDNTKTLQNALDRIKELEKENAELKADNDARKFAMVMSENVEKKLRQENAELKAQIEKMKCCENCKYNSYWGNELHCNYGLKEALQEDKLVECKNMDKWEIKENDNAKKCVRKSS